ncbi:hypothetical protein Lfu02_20710 [Longispora fulva]|uniref:Uncharacterized protein n=1 Tax=Longispora fulva TaxID=619741 RepID=A0A8J7KSR4_9ACTN|nr:hypothetical protein [Longispora fulva]MBG6139917.1 hypothetical protein [Longispora fulva]GIG57699.1 hypothetical protein Lfu02_20710 [Longispora fulva]
MPTITRLATVETVVRGGRAAVVSLRLDNDGFHTYWMETGDTYRLRIVGFHWQVTGGAWFVAGHGYRLTRAGNPLVSIPTDRGEVVLLPSHEYQISHAGQGEWWLSRCQ